MTPLYWFMSRRHGTPGLEFRSHVATAGIGLFLRRSPLVKDIYNLVFFPMDSVRYFEFDFMWESMRRCQGSVRRYLDISSPRLFPAMVMKKYREVTAEIVNPDVKDLEITRNMMEALGVSPRCNFLSHVVEDLQYPPETFDIIVSISAIEHIPAGGDRKAVSTLWEYLKPGGRLLLSFPCAREAFEEYIDLNEYGILPPDETGFFFGSTTYDAALLQERILSVTGDPFRSAIYGEKTKGSFYGNRTEKQTSPNYPFWREPYMMGKEYAYFGSIDELPGLGVIAMEFVKP